MKSIPVYLNQAELKLINLALKQLSAIKRDTKTIDKLLDKILDELDIYENNAEDYNSLSEKEF